MSKTKGLLRRGVRWPGKVLRKLDRKIQRGFTKIFRRLYKIKFLRPVTKRTYRFVHYHHRISATVLLAVLVVGVAVPIVQPYLRNQRYALNTQARGLLGEADKDLTKKLTFDDQQQVYQFNKDAKKTSTTEGNPLEKLKTQVGGGGEKDEQLYSVDVSRDLSKGVAYYDNQMELSFKITPQFKTMRGEQREGHLVYPLLGMKGQLAYTVGAGGVKENIVLYKSPGNDLRMSYKLDLPKSLEARLISETGELGIYSADPALFGSISYGSSDDQSKVENARNNSEKTFLTFKIPAPMVMGVGKTNQASVAAVSSKFELSGNTLNVVTTGLDKAEYPLSIDPSVTVDSNSDFQTGNFEDKNFNVENGDLKRGRLTGGSLNSTWSTGTNFPVRIGYHDVVAYNGYIYVLGGWDGDNIVDDVRFAAISGDGSIGGWTYTSDIWGGRSDHKAFAYNGYMYVLGGYSYDNGDVKHNDVQYAPILSNGYLGEWKPTTSFTTPRTGHAATAYNGYMYISGGKDASNNFLGDFQYAPINANGTVGAWITSTTTLGSPYAEHSMVAYNNFMYRVGGDWTDTVKFAPINANGDIGAWQSAPSLGSIRYGHAAAVYNGYLYVSGGNGYANTTLYAPIYASGYVGVWQSTTDLPSGRSHAAAAMYNGYFYIIGGDTAGGPLNQVRYAAVNPPGATGSYNTAANTFTTPRKDHSTVVYGNYMYVLGGEKSATGTACSGISSSYCNDVQYTPINADGTLGTWQTTSSFTTPRAWLGAVAYNGFMYISGGEKTYLSDVQYAPINANGTLGTWQYTTAMPTVNSGHAMVAYNGYMYTIAGYISGGGNTTAINRYAPINANGTIGTWQDTTSLNTARYDHAAIAYNGYMYAFGGSADSNRVQYAPINADGTLGTWVNNTTSMNAARNNLSAVIYNGYVYAFGGGFATAEYAPINANGTIGTWVDLNVNLPALRAGHGSVVYNGYVYIVGGSTAITGGSRANTTYYAQMNNGGSGTTGAWGSAGTDYTTARERIATVVYNGYIYVLGGRKGTSTTACRASGTGSGERCNDVQYAPINADGKIGSWTTNPNYFPNARQWHSAVAYNGYMYVLGGEYSGAARNDIQKALICTGANSGIGGCTSAAGSVGTWSQEANSFPTPRYSFDAVAYNGRMYITGGDNGSGVALSDVKFATINSDGSIANDWSSAGADFTTARREHSSVAYNGYLYVIAGSNIDDSVVYNDVQYAPINANGTIGGWTATTRLTQGRATPRALAYNGYLYIAGGWNNADFNDVQYAPINANGTIGQWTQGTKFSTGRYYHGTAIYNGYMYVLGGYGGGYRSDVQYAPINVIPRKGLYSKVIDLGTNSKVTGISYTGTVPGGVQSIKYRMAGGDGVLGSARSAVAPLVCSDSIGQYIQLFITLDDSSIGVFLDDANSNNAKVSSITVDSSPIGTPPEKRLRHGAWFNNGQLQPFENASNPC